MRWGTLGIGIQSAPLHTLRYSAARSVDIGAVPTSPHPSPPQWGGEGEFWCRLPACRKVRSNGLPAASPGLSTSRPSSSPRASISCCRGCCRAIRSRPCSPRPHCAAAGKPDRAQGDFRLPGRAAAAAISALSGKRLYLESGLSVKFYPQTVGQVLLRSLPWTVLLVATSSVLAFALGSLAGARAAWRRGGGFDSFVAPGAIMLQAVAAAGHLALGAVPVRDQPEMAADRLRLGSR